MKLTVNNEAYELTVGNCLQALMEQLGKAEQSGVAVAVNGSVVTAGRWETHRLSAGDDVLIIQATQGG